MAIPIGSKCSRMDRDADIAVDPYASQGDWQMTTAQCLAASFWAACALDVFSSYGASGVAGFMLISGVIAGAVYRKFFAKEQSQ